MTARNGISESELLNLVPVAWYDWLMLFSALQHSGITVTRMGLVLFANEQVSKTELALLKSLTGFVQSLEILKDSLEICGPVLRTIKNTGKMGGKSGFFH